MNFAAETNATDHSYLTEHRGEKGFNSFSVTFGRSIYHINIIFWNTEFEVKISKADIF